MSEETGKLPLKRYPTYRPSGVIWIGDIPIHWQCEKIKYCSEIPGDNLSFKPNDVMYIALENIESGTGRLLLEEPIEEVESGVSGFKAGDILFGKLRPYLAKVVQLNFDGVCSNEFIVFRPYENCLHRYLFYLLLSDGFISHINSLTYGTKMPRANPQQIINSLIPLPPLPEQQAIAGFLDRETGRIDALIAHYQRLIELLEEQRTAIISQAVTRGLDPTVMMKDSGVEWLGEIPAHWEVIALKRISTIVTGTTPSKIDEENYQDGEYLWVKPDELTGFEPIIDTREKISQKGIEKARLVPMGSTLVCCIGTIGKIGYAGKNLSTNQQINSITFHPTKMDNRYGLYILSASADEHKRRANIVVIGILNKDNQGEINLPVPPISEQVTIVGYLEQETKQCDLRIRLIHQMVETLVTYRSALISSAVTGKIDVR